MLSLTEFTLNIGECGGKAILGGCKRENCGSRWGFEA